jgi:hypothetical protein
MSALGRDIKGSIMNPNKALWEKSDFARIAVLLRASGEALVNSLGITAPLRALDLGCGDGATSTDGGTSIPATFLQVTVSL